MFKFNASKVIGESVVTAFSSSFTEILLKKIDFYTVKDFLKEQLGKTISILFHNNTMKMVSKIKK